MKKKVFAAFLAGVTAAGLLAGCGSSSSDTAQSAAGGASEAAEASSESPASEVSEAPAASTEETSDQTAGASTPDYSADSGEIYMFISSPEYADAINTLIDQYKEVAPNVTINYETTQNDYPTMLKAKINSGDVPDIFSSTSGMEIDTYREYSYDLTDEPIAAAMDDGVKQAMASAEEGNKGVYGLAIKGNYFGIVYNKDILDACGVEFPQTLDEFKEACKTIEDKGYQACSTGFMEWWVFKQSSMNFLNAAAAANGETPADMVKKFQAGEAHIQDYDILYNNWFDFVDTAVKYGDDKPLETDLSGEEQALASGNVAFIFGQGPWVESDLLAINPDLNIGFAGYPCDDNPADCQVVSGSDQALHVYKDSENLQAVLDFVNWWYTSDYGQSWFTDVANVVPPIKTDAASTSTIVEQGKAAVEEKGSGALSECYSTDSFNQAFGEDMQSYISGDLTKDECCSQIEKDWHNIDGAAAN